MNRTLSVRAHVGLHSAILIGLAACGTDEDYGELSSAVSVETYVTQSCTTSVVLGLAKQIADEIACSSPTDLVKFDPTANLQITSSAVMPYLHSTARTDLLAVAASRVVRLNSAFRTVAQQYLLYRWDVLGRCGISTAAKPGRSNHESGRALDVANYSSLITAMANRGWAHDVPGDPVHFDHLSSPDIRGKDTLAFQRLWNRNHPGDLIAADGLYGPQTEARLKQSPATGFATGPQCAAALATGPDVVMIEGPDKVAPGTRAHFAITVANRTTEDWPASTQLAIAGGVASDLHDPQTWISPTVVGTLDGDIGAGAQGVIELDIQAPSPAEETSYTVQLALASGATTFGTFSIALTVTPNGDEGTSTDADDQFDDAPETTGGCSTGGGAGWAMLVLGALVGARSRRRR